MIMRRIAALASTLLFSGVCLSQTPAFEAVSIKPARPGTAGRSLSENPGPRLTTSNATLKMLVMFAYRVMPDQVSGGPGWVESDGFDIDAKASDAKVTPAQLRGMVQAFLADRFQLQVHRTTKELPIYELVQAKGGTRLTESHDESGEIGVRIEGPGRISGVKGTMVMLANTLSRPLQRRVVDQTGLTGAYSFKLLFAPEQKQRRPTADDDTAAPSDGPSIFTALQEQLGLSLKAARGPVETIVIDRAARPDAN
jgi:uncharacterized protein (TIGR03435 family)